MYLPFQWVTDGKKKENEKINFARELKNLWNMWVIIMPIVNCNWCTRNIPKRLDINKKNRGIGNLRKNRDHLCHSIRILKTQRDLLSLTPGKDDRLKWCDKLAQS